jgi:hypothetical protein
MAGFDCLFKFASSSAATSNSAMNCSTIRPISARGRSFFFFFLPPLKSRSISSSSSPSSAYSHQPILSVIKKQNKTKDSIWHGAMAQKWIDIFDPTRAYCDHGFRSMRIKLQSFYQILQCYERMSNTILQLIGNSSQFSG